MNGTHRTLSLFAALLATATLAVAGFDSLLNNSPFIPPANNAPTAASETLELRGFVVENGRPSLNIFDTSTKKATWVSIDEPGLPYIVRSFDPSNDTATIEINRRSVALPLKRASVQLAAAMPVAAAAPPPVGINLVATPGQQPAAGGTPVAINPSTGAAPDQARLQAIADEIRRRRAMRAQNQGQPPTPGADNANAGNPGRRGGNPAMNQQRN